MSEYGIQPTGYVRKPIAVILAELEAAMITEFGPGVIQTSQSPFGQLNGLIADLVAEIDERNLDLYQSIDPDQAEGNRLDILSRLRLINRGDSDDVELRKAITNDGQARVDIQDLSHAVKGLNGVTYAQVFVNETGEIDSNNLETGTVAVAVIGGSDIEIALAIRKYVVPGVNTYGNTRIESQIDGFCRSFSIIRPFEIDINLSVQVKTSKDKFGCPAPSTTSIKETLIEKWNEQRINGLDVSFYNVRSIIESFYGNVEVHSIIGERDEQEYLSNETVPIAFIEIAKFLENNITVSFVS
jgi:hypothetical protein